MSEFTYEAANSESRLETYEFDNVWWEHANTKGTPRVLYIGDSISCGTRRKATEVAENKIFFDGFGTSKALDNPYFADSIRMFAKQQGERVSCSTTVCTVGIWMMKPSTVSITRKCSTFC